MASSSTPSSSTTTLTKKYEVFLSFRGLDTRQGFTSHLYDALCRKNIKTFRDDDELRRGVEISPALLRAIEESKIAVVIFSKNYASSEWCLAELAEIIKRMKLKELIVMPVFYNVDPSDVQELKGSYDCSFANNEEIGRVGMFSWFSWLLLVVSVCNSCKKKKLQEEVQKWREALTEASNQAGFDSSVIRPEAELVREIVKAVWMELRSKYIPSSSDFKGLVGIHERNEQVKALLCLDMMDDRKIIGIWGMGGVGKTTIAQAVFKSISYKFDGACFIEKVGKRLEDGGSEQLQLDVLSKVLHEENLKLDTPIRPDIMGLLNQKKVFIVLDDVNDIIKSKSKSLSECLSQCGLGSRMIITSRDKQVLHNFEVDDHEIYEEKGLNDVEALELFHEYANPTEDCMALSKKIVNYAKGNPLALEVLGSFLKGKNNQVWESALNNLQGIVNSKVFDVLKISYDGLNQAEQDLFLDLACFNYFYDGDFRLAEAFVDCQEYKHPLEVLVDKKLIEIKIDMVRPKIHMHDLLREMGREIVCSKSPKILGNRSRLWKPDDVIQILEKNTGTAAVEGISLDMDDIEEDIDLSSEVFDKMDNLRIISFYNTRRTNKLRLPNGLNCLPDELMILYWPNCTFRELPPNFKPKKLVKLDLHSSDIEQLWKGTKRAPKLKRLSLRNCPRLTKIPNLSDFPLLVKVDLTDCKSLVDLTSSGQQLNNLRYLTLEGCINVTKFPLISENIETLNLSGTAIEEVPSSIQSLTNLTKLDLSECTRLNHISPSICKLKSLSDLSLRGCSKLDKLPDELGNLKSLKKLIVSGFAVGRLPSSITSLENLEELECSRCSLMGIPEDIDCLFSLKKLELSGNMFESLPKRIKQFYKLETLSLSHCDMLQSLPEFPKGLKYLEAMDCEQLCQVPDASEFVRCINSIPHLSVKFIFANSLNLKAAVSNVFEESLRLMQRIKKESGNPSNQFSFYLPGNEIPEWFSGQSLESSIKIRVLRNDLVNRKFMGFAICAVLRVDEYNRCEIRYNHCFHSQIRDDSMYLPSNRIQGPNIFMDSEHMLLGYCPFYSSSQNPEKLPDSDYLNILIEFGYNQCGCNGPKRCAVHPIYAEEPLEIIGATIQEIGETSGRRSDRSDENDEEVEPHPKRICTQEI